jgi:hypothetical protein
MRRWLAPALPERYGAAPISGSVTSAPGLGLLLAHLPPAPRELLTRALIDGSSPVTKRRVALMSAASGVLSL